MIFGMGMLEMGITFSFGQLLIDDAIVRNVQRTLEKKATLPGTIADDLSHIGDFVADYVKGSRYKTELTEKIRGAGVFGDRRSGENLAAAANSLAGEIIGSHRVEPVDAVVKREMRRIVTSAEL